MSAATTPHSYLWSCFSIKYWSFSFSICPSNDHSGLISFRIDSFDLLAVPKIIQAISAGVWMDGWSRCFLNVFFRNSAYSRISCVCEYCERKKCFRRSNVKARHGLGREVVTGSFVCKGLLLHQPMMQALKEPLTGVPDSVQVPDALKSEADYTSKRACVQSRTQSFLWCWSQQVKAKSLSNLLNQCSWFPVSANSTSMNSSNHESNRKKKKKSRKFQKPKLEFATLATIYISFTY